MGITVALEHRTTYTFDRAVQIHPHVVRLRPAPHARTKIESYSLTVEPAGHFLNWQQDPFGNFMARLVFPEKSDRLSITVGLVADMAVLNPFDFFIEEYAETYGFAYPPDLAADLEPYLKPVDEDAADGSAGPLVREWLTRFDAAARHARSSTSWSRSTVRSTATSATRCGWSRGCRPRTTRCAARSAPAGTAPGCWCRCCVSWAWPPASSPAT